MSRRSDQERYEPLPGLAELPGWVWRRMGRRLRLGIAIAVLATVTLGVAAVPEIRQAKQEQAEAERRERAELRAQLIRKLEAEQRPRFRRSESVAPAGASDGKQLAARARLMDELAATISADARRRVREGALKGPILRTECEPFPRTVKDVGADQDLARRRGRYYCVAVTSEFKRSESSLGGVLGHPYRALVDFRTGRYAYCKISGSAGPTREPLVTTPRACGGT